MWHNVTQNSEYPCECCGKTWMELREGRITGTSISSIMAHYGKEFGDPAEKLALDIAIVELGGSSTPNNYKNSHMERGNTDEPIARKLYENMFFCEVKNGGFFGKGRIGCSPDGLLYANGLIEIKSQQNSVHHKLLESGGYPSQYKWQLIHNLKVSEKDYIVFISYCSTYVPDKKIYTYEIFKDDVKTEFEQIDSRIEKFNKLIDFKKETIRRFQWQA